MSQAEPQTEPAQVSDHEARIRLETVLEAMRQDHEAFRGVTENRVQQIADLRVENDMLVTNERERVQSLQGTIRRVSSDLLLTTLGVEPCIVELAGRLRESERILTDILAFIDLVMEKTQIIPQKDLMLAIWGLINHNLKPSLIEELTKQITGQQATPTEGLPVCPKCRDARTEVSQHKVGKYHCTKCQAYFTPEPDDCV